MKFAQLPVLLMALVIAAAVVFVTVNVSGGVSLPTGPVDVVWDHEICAHCRMHVGDPAFAVQVQTVAGEVMNFDDVGCAFQWLAAGGVDAFCIETMSDYGEISLAIRAAKDATGLPVIATLTYDKGPRGFFTMFGITPAQGAEKLAEAGADVVGSNCGIAIDDMIEIIAAMRAVTDMPILTHINAGIPRVENGQIIYPDTPQFMAERINTVVEALK